MWLIKCVISLVSEHFQNSDSQHVKQSEKVHQSISIILFHHLAKIELENVCLSASEVPRVFVNTLTADKQYSLRNRKKLRQPIQLQLPKKNKTFSDFFG